MKTNNQIILDSTYSAIKTWKWQELLEHHWRDFALAILETETEQETKGIQVERGNINEETITEQNSKGIEIMSLLHELQFDNETEMNVAIFVSAINFYARMMDYLPWYDKINLTFQDVLRVIDIALRYIEERNEKVYRNLFLDTSIEMLSLYEKRLGIETNINLSYKQRRRQIQARRIAAFEQTTEETIKEICSAFSSNNAGVEVNETEIDGVYDIKFISNGLPNNMKELDKTLSIMFPAHLMWEYSYTQNSWDIGTDGGTIRWKDLAPYSWKQFNEYKGGKAS